MARRAMALKAIRETVDERGSLVTVLSNQVYQQTVRGRAHLFLRRLRSPRSFLTLWGRRPAPSPSSGLSYVTDASCSGSGLFSTSSTTNTQCVSDTYKSTVAKLQLYNGFIKDTNAHVPNWWWNLVDHFSNKWKYNLD